MPSSALVKRVSLRQPRRRSARPWLVTARHPCHAVASYWILRMLAVGGAWDSPWERLDLESVLSAIDMADLIPEEGFHPKDHRRQRRSYLAGKRLLSAACQRAGERLPELPAELATNLEALQVALHLGTTETRILAFAIVLELNEPLAECVSAFGRLDYKHCCTLLGNLLQAERDDLARALAPDGILATSGLLRYDYEDDDDGLRFRLPLQSGFARRMLEPCSDTFQLFSGRIKSAPVPTLDLADFPHLKLELADILKVLRHAHKRGTRGLNILIYGDVGTGKTEVARVLAEHLDVELFELADSQDGHALCSRSRTQALQTALALLQGRRDALVLVDEAENVLDGWTPRFSNGGKPKAMLNNLLQSNPVPILWISNEHAFEDSFLRRFAIVVEFPTPPLQVRKEIIREACSRLPISEDWIANAARHEALPPAVIVQAAETVQSMGYRKPERVEGALNRILKGKMEVMGREATLFAPVPATEPEIGLKPLRIRLDVLHTNPPVQPLITRLGPAGAGRLCLYGPPGTGKTEFARQIAVAAQRPLLTRHASDLLNAYVGESEKAIASMFAEAQAQNAVLLLDEADSFLRTRSSGAARWENSQTNELLTQMERFKGIFVCSTNLPDLLDEAVHRRFDFQICFKWLRPEGAWLLFQDVLEAEGYRCVAARQPALRAALDQLETLAPGDFAKSVRQLRIMGERVTPESLLDALKSEVNFKRRRTGNAIGFTAVN